MLSYAIITPAHNEEGYLQRTVASVQAQVWKPVRWIIVNDASSDGTQLVAQRAASSMDFVRVVSTDRGDGRCFSNKARAFNTGVEHLKGVNYDLIGNVDADVSFDPFYFSNLVHAFEADDALGISGGTIFTAMGDRFVTQDQTPDSVAGAVQLFRRKCFEDVGGQYMPLPYGGIDAAAEITARSKGWKVAKSLADRVNEHRRTGTAAATPLVACFRLGCRFHSLGYDWLFLIARCLYRMADEPIVLGSCAQLCGYLMSALRCRPQALPADVVCYLRHEQGHKLSQLKLSTIVRAFIRHNRPLTPPSAIESWSDDDKWRRP